MRRRLVGNSVPAAIDRYINSAYDNVLLVAENIESVNKAVENIEYLQRYLGVYEGGSPSERPDGSPLETGDFYYSDKATYYYNADDDTWTEFNPEELLTASADAVDAAARAEEARDVAVDAEQKAYTLVGGTDIGDYEDDPTFNNITDYVVFGRGTSEIALFKVEENVDLPYTVDSTANPHPTDDDNLRAYTSTATMYTYEETTYLTDGQVVVDATSELKNYVVYLWDSASGERERLDVVYDYTTNNSNQIVLTDTYPVGSIVTIVFEDIGQNSDTYLKKQEAEQKYGDHNKQANRGSENSHPASAISTEDGSNVEDTLSHKLDTASLPDYTDIVYKSSGGNSAVENMISGIPTQATIGTYVETDSYNAPRYTRWLIKSSTEPWEYNVPLDSGLFAVVVPKNGVLHVDDCGAYPWLGDGPEADTSSLSDSSAAFNAAYLHAFWDPSVQEVSHGKVYRSDNQIDFVNGQSLLDAAVTNYDLTFKLTYANTRIDFYGSGDFAYYARHRTTQKAVRNAITEGKLRLFNFGSWDYGFTLVGFNWGDFDSITGEDFLISSISIESNNGKGGLWSFFKSLYGSGGSVPVNIGQTANSNTFGSLFAGYGSKGCLENYGSRNQFGRVSIENSIIGREDTLEHCARFFASANIDTFEAEMNGVDGAEVYIGSLIPDGDSTVVSVTNPTFVGVGTRIVEINGGSVFLTPKQNLGVSGDFTEIYSTYPIRSPQLYAAREPVYTESQITSGTENNYGSYTTITGSNAFNWRSNPRKITLTNNSGDSMDFQVRAQFFDATDGPSVIKTLLAGTTVDITYEELNTMIGTRGIPVIYKCRVRSPVANSIGDVEVVDLPT